MLSKEASPRVGFMFLWGWVGRSLEEHYTWNLEIRDQLSCGPSVILYFNIFPYVHQE